MKKLPRTVVHVVWDAERKLWRAEIERRAVDLDAKRSSLIDCWADVLDSMKVDHAILGQLVVHTKDGRIAFERTYGKDPARTRG